MIDRTGMTATVTTTGLRALVVPAALLAFVLITVLVLAALRRRPGHRSPFGRGPRRTPRRAEARLGAELQAAHQRIRAELEAHSRTALPTCVGSAALSARRLRSEHGDETVQLVMSNGASVTLGSLAAPAREELIRTLRAGPVVLTAATEQLPAFRLQFADLWGMQYAVWSRTVRVIDARPTPVGR